MKRIRPEAKFYEPSVDEWAFEHYVEDLEKYCDELEQDIRIEREERKADQDYIADWDTTRDWYWNKIKRLEKALDKACEELEIIDYENKMCHNPLAYDCDHKDACQWKEWLMKDE